MKKERLLIFGNYGWNNTGDDAMLYGLLQELAAFHRESEFVIPSRIPVTVPAHVKNRVRFVKPSPIHVLWEMVRASLFIVGGGTHLHDYGRRRNRISVLLAFLIIVFLAKMLRNEVYLISNGIGPITTIWGRALTRLICRRADYITVRDQASYGILEALGLANRISLAFDLSALLPLPDESHGNQVGEGVNGRILGVSVTPVFELYHGDRDKDLLIVNEIGEQLSLWLSKTPDLKVFLFIFKDKPRNDDVHITRLLVEQLRPVEQVTIIPYNLDSVSTLAKVSKCYAFIGMKYHSSLFAYLGNVPLLIIDYHPKCRALAEEIGLANRATISLHEILNGEFGERLRNLLEYPEGFLATLSVSLAKERARTMPNMKRHNLPPGIDSQPSDNKLDIRVDAVKGA